MIDYFILIFRRMTFHLPYIVGVFISKGVDNYIEKLRTIYTTV